ncbi:V-type ATPase 116kDa subunit family protein [Maribellus sp. YY47]|uniref:V-type ATP synthase subunit I n=1 Tax=Maribellus sp. YY47 TaxID=2929486 RepID=UPI0020014B20|nr:V-type ATPase 116kDa subunit family protein [Maribellus sp. YY47]MCK3684482.1 V-type ATP synthase subunit I [Maribellus sp. YY47]
MIVPMIKYSFLVFYKEYNTFLEEIQKLGVLHIIEKEADFTKELKDKFDEIKTYEKAIRVLKKRNIPEQNVEQIVKAEKLPEAILDTEVRIGNFESKLEELNAAYEKARSWGKFSPELRQKLKAENICLEFYSAPSQKFHELNSAGVPVVFISGKGTRIFFVLIRTNNREFDLDLEPVNLPEIPASELEKQIERTNAEIDQLNKKLDEYATFSLSLLEQKMADLINKLEFEKVKLTTEKNADDKLMLLEGWIPRSKSDLFNLYLEDIGVLYVRRWGTPKDKIPVLLKNNRFSSLFEPIGSLFSLPDYAEIDLTVFFAPFFMLFFGFCLGDAGYGLLFLVGGGIYKPFADKKFLPYLSLLQFLGVATFLFGMVSGTFFGINLIEAEFSFTQNFRNLFLDPNKMFQLSLALGSVQIIFGLFLKAANQMKQFGYRYALSTCGWLIIVLGGLLYALLSRLSVIPSNTAILYALIFVGGFLVLFFSDPQVNVFARVGKGIWDVYSTVTGIFGDLLSYIRLFALGLSSAILGFVINDIGLQILGSSKILGPVFFVIFLILGHTLNILISSLGSFVHPMRLTFVEFYKNAGFKGGGRAYKPFCK